MSILKNKLNLTSLASLFLLLLQSTFASSEVIFEENFDGQPDWTSTSHSIAKEQAVSKGDALPENWYSIYQGTMWSPETGYADKHASLEILSKNNDKARGGEGKSAVHWRESYSQGWTNWASDSQLVKLLDQQYDQIYIEFWISFSDNFYGREHAAGWESKLFRIGSWSGEGSIFNGAQGNIGPLFIWYYLRDKYGVRNSLSFRGGPWGENYMMDQSEPSFPQHASKNYGSDTLGQAPEGADSMLINQVDGGYLSEIDRYTWITHNQVFGEGRKWTKVAFFLKLNSAPDATDGVLRQWINDEQILNLQNVPWIKANTSNKMVGWNYFAIGGNDYFQPVENDQRFEDWYAIDDIVVRTDIPSAAAGGGGPAQVSDVVAPAPPSNLVVQ